MTLLRTIWSNEDLECLKSMVRSGTSAQRACAVLKRPLKAIKNRAKRLPFPDERELKQAPPNSPRTRLADICRSCRPMAASTHSGQASRRTPRFPLRLLRRACPTPSRWRARPSQTLSGRDFLSRPSSLPRKPASRRCFWSCCAGCHTLKPAQARQHRRTTTRQASAVHFRRAGPAQRDCLERRAGETASEPTPKREDKGKIPSRAVLLVEKDQFGRGTNVPRRFRNILKCPKLILRVSALTKFAEQNFSSDVQHFKQLRWPVGSDLQRSTASVTSATR